MMSKIFFVLGVVAFSGDAFANQCSKFRSDLSHFNSVARKINAEGPKILAAADKLQKAEDEYRIAFQKHNDEINRLSRLERNLEKKFRKAKKKKVKKNLRRELKGVRQALKVERRQSPSAVQIIDPHRKALLDSRRGLAGLYAQLKNSTGFTPSNPEMQASANPKAFVPIKLNDPKVVIGNKHFEAIKKCGIRVRAIPVGT